MNRHRPTSRVLNAESQNIDKCPICLENLSYNNRKLFTTECGHTFHMMCFNKLPKATCDCCNALMILKVHCPYCRTRIPFAPEYRMTLCKQNLKTINEMIFSEEVKTVQYYDYYTHKINLVSLQVELWRLMENDPRNRKEITKCQQSIEHHTKDMKYIEEEICRCTYRLRLHKDNILAHITALTDILKPAA